MYKTTVLIKGMHCNSCEILIEDELTQIPGVVSTKVSRPKGCAEITHTQPISHTSIAEAVKDAGYGLGKADLHFFSRNGDDYMQVGIVVLSLIAFWILASTFGIFSSFKIPELNNYASLPIVFLIGVTAGISTCMALIGGLVLGASARFAEKHPSATPLQKFKPHLFFNLGRIISFFIFGAIIGYAGSFFKFSTSTLGLLIIFVSFVMLILGIQLTELFPGLSKFKLTLPKQLTRILGIKEHNEKEYSHTNAALLGGTTFFLPCGFTQAMQLYAMSTGNPVTASLTMGIFAIGTAPGLLGIGGLTSIVKGVFASWFFKFAGVVVIILAFYNLQGGINLSGIDKQIGKIFSNKVLSASADNIPSGGNVVLQSTYSVANDMQPNNFSVNAGSKVTLEVKAEDDGAGCMGSLALPGLSDKVEVFRKGVTTVFTFSADTPGEYLIACAMGVPRGTIKVI